MSVEMEFIELDSILDDCLERLQRGEDLESCLASYPEQGQELRALLVVAANVTDLELPKTSQTSTDAGREQMYAALKNKKLKNYKDIQTIPVSIVGILRYLEQVQATIKLNLSKEFLVMHKTVIAIVLVLVMLFGGSAVSAYAAQGSLPGDPLYPMKTAIEDASVDFSMDSASEVRLYLSLAEKRITEIESLAAEGRYEDMAVAVERFETHIEKAITGLLVVAQGNPAEAESLAATLGELLERHAQVLLALMVAAPENAKAAFEDAVEASQEGISAASEIAGDEASGNENSSPDQGETGNANEMGAGEEDNGNLNSNDEAEEQNENLNGDEENGNENGSEQDGEEGSENENGEDGNMNGDDEDEEENVNGDHEEDEDENTNSHDDDDESTNGDDDEEESEDTDNGDDSNSDEDDSDDDSDNANGDEDESNENSSGEEEDGMNENGDESDEDSTSETNDNSSEEHQSGDGEDNSNESSNEDSSSNQNDNSGDEVGSSDDSASDDNENDEDASNENDNEADNSNDNSDNENDSENENSEEEDNTNS
jgi:hypothetical protein